MLEYKNMFSVSVSFKMSVLGWNSVVVTTCLDISIFLQILKEHEKLFLLTTETEKL